MNKQFSLLLTLDAITFTGCEGKKTVTESSVVPAANQTVTQKESQTNEVAFRVRGIISKQLKLPIDRVKLSNTFNQLGADSLDIVEIILASEEEFKVQFPDNRIDAIKTVGDLVDFFYDNGKR